MLFFQLLFVLGLANFTQALLPQSTKPLPPSQDPFYRPPAGFETKAPGTILNSRKIEASVFGELPAFFVSQSFQLLYRTTAVNGTPIATVTTILVPRSAPKDRFVSYDAIVDSSATQCAPSYSIQMNSPTNVLTQIDSLSLQSYILKGWIVVYSDHQGPDAAFGAGRLGGMATLDGMRAALSYTPLGLLKNATIVDVGYSGGAIATAWASSLKSKYANELNIVGWAMGGVAVNLTGAFVNLDKQRSAGLIPSAIAGLSTPSAYPQLQKTMDPITTAAGKAALQYVQNHCGDDDINSYIYKSFLSTQFTTLGDRLLYDPTVMQVLSDNLMGKNKDEFPTAPVLIYHSTDDQTLPFSNVSALVNTWCQYGAKIQFSVYSRSGHIGTNGRALQDVIDFVEKSFDGKSPITGCTRKEIPFSPLALPVALEPVLAKYLKIANSFDGDKGLNSNEKSPSTPVKGAS